MIKPTVGRIVWFYVNHEAKDPRAAIIAKVHNDGLVNLGVFDEDGGNFPYRNVPLVQENEPVAFGVPFCTWMPYQIGQAKAHANSA